MVSHIGPMNILSLCNTETDYYFYSKRIYAVIAIVISFLPIANIFKITKASSAQRCAQRFSCKECTVKYKKIARRHTLYTSCDLLWAIHKMVDIHPRNDVRWRYKNGYLSSLVSAQSI